MSEFFFLFFEISSTSTPKTTTIKKLNLTPVANASTKLVIPAPFPK